MPAQVSRLAGGGERARTVEGPGELVLGIAQGAKVIGEAGLPDDVQRASRGPSRDIDDRLSLAFVNQGDPSIAEAVGLFKEDGEESSDLQRSEGRVQQLPLAMMVLSLGEKDAFAQDPSEIASDLIGFGKVVGVCEDVV
jgi:hypothetical protein